MPNPLEIAAGAPDPEPSVKSEPKTEALSEAAQLLEGVNQGTANELLRVFDEATRITGAKMGEVMWTVAMVQARCLASADMGDAQEWVARRFHELVRLALPGMMMAVERAKQKAKGTPNDA